MRNIATKLVLVAGFSLAAAISLGGSSAFASSHRDPTQGHYQNHPRKKVVQQRSVQSHAKKTKPARRGGKAVADARDLFAAAKLPSNQTPQSFGEYFRGCLAGASTMPLDGPHWQVMSPSRNRFYARQVTIDYLKAFSVKAFNVGFGNGILLGDLGQPRGGPMWTGHASHQIGLDVDIWLEPAPNRTLTAEERETMEAPSMLKPGTNDLDLSRWTPEYSAFVREAAQDPGVARIFVNSAIKAHMCSIKDPSGKDTEWMRKLRPWPGHDDHIHVRMHIPAGETSADEQDPPPPGDGCNALAVPSVTTTAAPHATGFPMSKLPAACKAVLKSKP